MRSRHHTIRAVAIALGLALLVVTGTAAMMAAFSPTPAATDIYRRAAVDPADQFAPTAGGHDSLLYERVVLPGGRVQWVLVNDAGTSWSLATNPATATLAETAGSSLELGAVSPFSYTLVAKPFGLSKAVTECTRSAYGAYDIACTTMI